MQCMKKTTCVLMVLAALLMGCANEFNRVYKTDDNAYKYEYAKECFVRGKYQRAITLLDPLIHVTKGTDNGEECLYMLGMAQYCISDYESAAMTFRKYYQSYPKGIYAELASFFTGESLFKSTPEPRLDQTPTVQSIAAFQEFMDLFPQSDLRRKAQDRLFTLQDKLVLKELFSAQLYYNLGPYFGNCNSNGESNYEACIVTAQNALKDYPYSKHREEFSLLVMKSKFALAQNSAEGKKLDRFRDAEDECYGFINEYPESRQRPLAEKYIRTGKKHTGGTADDNETTENE